MSEREFPDRPGVYAARRARVFAALGGDSALVLAAAPEVRVGRDLELRYRPDPDLYYLTCYPEPEAVAVLCPANDDAPFTLFVRDRDPSQELWTGPRGGPAEAMDRFAADAAYPVADLPAKLPPILRRVSNVYAPLSTHHGPLGSALRDAIASARPGRQRTGRGPRAFLDPGVLLDPMRVRKDAHELERIREAARITAEGFRDAAAVIRAGAGEWEVEATLEAAFRRRGADGSGFAPIIAAGPNATVLHYIENASRMERGQLLLLDAGARFRMYHGDISRTFPVGGRFDELQRELYDTVLAARDAAMAAVRPGSAFEDVHRAAVRVLVAGLVEHRLLDGDVDGLVEREDDYKPFFPHRTSHWLGLDVHDVGEYARGDEPVTLEPGMVLTIEPGLYFSAGPGDPAIAHGDPGAGAEETGRGSATGEAARAGVGRKRRRGNGRRRTGDAEPTPTASVRRPEIPERYRGIGIRIEDDVLVTTDGCEVLTEALPSDARAVEAMVPGPGT